MAVPRLLPPSYSPLIPAELFAVAARRPAYHGRVVKVSVAGDDMLCLIGDEGGSPADWYAAMRAYAELETTSSAMAQHLPRGLRAMALRDPANVLLCVSLLCTASEQKAAARRLLRTARSLRWLPTPGPAPLAPLTRASQSGAASLAAHPVLTSLAVSGTVVVGSAGVLAALGLLPVSKPATPIALPPPQLFLSQPPQPSGAPAGHHRSKPHHQVHSALPVPPPLSSPQPSPSPSASTVSRSSAPSRSPSPKPSPSSPRPSSPSPIPTQSTSPTSSPATSPSSSPSRRPPAGGSWSWWPSSPASAGCWAWPTVCTARGPAGWAGDRQLRAYRQWARSHGETFGSGQNQRDGLAMTLIYLHF